MTVTIIGAGLAGTIIGYNLIKQGKSVRIFDAGTKYVRQNQQIPWGWYRRVSLQCKSKIKTATYYNELPFMDEINLTKGPMLITTKSIETIKIWENWLKNNSYSDAKILNPNDGENIFKIPKFFSKGLFLLPEIIIVQ